MVSVKALAQGLVDVAQTRLRLLQTELQDEADRLGTLLALQLLTALAGLVTVQLAALVILTLVWDTPWRTPAMLLLAGAAAGLTVWARLRFQSCRRQAPPPFAGSLRELDKDRQALENLR